MEQLSTRDLLIHLRQGNFQAALDLVTEIGLDKDVVLKAQWTKLRNDKEPHIETKDLEVLEQVEDDAWLVSQCLDTVIDNPDLQKRLLTVGQERTRKQTEKMMTQLNENSQLTIQEKTWLRSRFYFLQYLDRLETMRKISNESGFAESYSNFRDCNLVALAVESARNENSICLDALFLHHGRELLPYRLFILSQIPETSDPSRFDLPHVTQDHEDLWLEEPWREIDDVEQEWVQNLILLDVPEQITYKTRLDEGISATKYPASSKVIADWYIERAQAADKIGLANNALEIIRYAQVMGISNIESRISEYEWLCRYVYTSLDNQYVDLEKFQKLSNYEVLDGLLRTTDAKGIVGDMHCLALPWLEICKNRKTEEEEEGAEFLLYRWLLDTHVVDDHLDWCCLVCEDSKPTIDVEERIIKDDLNLSRLVLSILYSNDGSNMDNLVRLFECLPIFPDTPQQENEIVHMVAILPYASTPLGMFTALQSAGAYGLTQMIDMLQRHLSSAEVLARYHSHVPLCWYLKDQTEKSQHQLCTRMASQAAGGVESSGAQFSRDDDWRELLDDMLRLRDDGQGVFGKLESVVILEIFFSSLLRCARFKLAKELILESKLIDINKAEALVIDAEREFFDNATSGDMDSGSLKLAWDCLNILPPTTEIKKEMDLIEATHIIITEFEIQYKPGIQLMPIQVRQAPDRLEFVSKLLHAKRDVYNNHEKVLQLVHRLGYAKNDTLAKVKALSLLASSALVEEDYMQSYRLCQLAVEMALEKSSKNPKSYNDQVDQSAWQICFNLGKLHAFEDINRRLDVLSMAMSLSPVENIPDVLAVWRDLDATKPSQIELAQIDADRYETQSSPKWQGLLQNATKQWSLGDLLTSGEQGDGKRKRDLVRNVVGNWLF